MASPPRSSVPPCLVLSCCRTVVQSCSRASRLIVSTTGQGETCHGMSLLSSRILLFPSSHLPSCRRAVRASGSFVPSFPRAVVQSLRCATISETQALRLYFTCRYIAAYFTIHYYLLFQSLIHFVASSLPRSTVPCPLPTDLVIFPSIFHTPHQPSWPCSYIPCSRRRDQLPFAYCQLIYYAFAVSINPHAH